MAQGKEPWLRTHKSFADSSKHIAAHTEISPAHRPPRQLPVHVPCHPWLLSSGRHVMQCVHITTSQNGRDILEERDAKVACLACKKQLMHFGLENVYIVEQRVHGKDHKRESRKRSLVKRPISSFFAKSTAGRCAPLAFGFACCSRNRSLRSVWRRVQHCRVYAACPRYDGTWPCE